MEQDNYISHAKSRCQNVIYQYPGTWEGELLVRMNKLLKRNLQDKEAYRFDQAEIEEIRNLLGWNKS